MISAQKLVKVVPTLTRASARFGKYKREFSQPVRTPDAKQNKVIAQLKQAWTNFQPFRRGFSGGGLDPSLTYETVIGLIQRISYSAKDVENFSILLAECQEETGFAFKAGLFLSALISNGKEKDYVVYTHHLSESIQYLGSRNTKNVNINGDVGYSCAWEMKSGTLIVNGNVGDAAANSIESGNMLIRGDAGDHVGCYMQGGTVTVEGNAFRYAGADMQGGLLVIKGNADYETGAGMYGGRLEVFGNAGELVGYTAKGSEIHIQGDYESVYIEGTGSCGVKIYYKGVLIVKDGREIE